jgi:hypothetical protein
MAKALAVLAAEPSEHVRLWEPCSVRLGLANECSTVNQFRLALRAHNSLTR